MAKIGGAKRPRLRRARIRPRRLSASVVAAEGHARDAKRVSKKPERLWPHQAISRQPAGNIRGGTRSLHWSDGEHDGS